MALFMSLDFLNLIRERICLLVKMILKTRMRVRRKRKLLLLLLLKLLLLPKLLLLLKSLLKLL